MIDFNQPAIQALPISHLIPKILDILKSKHELIIQAAPGAGKTTLVPLALLTQNWLCNKKIIVLEPRRIAAKSTAIRMADLLDEKIGHTIGYRTRHDSQTGPHTKIEVITEGILTRWLIDDPSLEGISTIIFDEFHERSIHTDTGFALTLQGRDLFRETDKPLRLIVMSATLDGQRVSHLLNGAPVVCSEGRTHSVDIVYGKDQALNTPLIPQIVSTIKKAITAHEGNILVFVPGQKEIHGVINALQTCCPDAVVLLPLYSSLPFEEQQKAILPIEILKSRTGNHGLKRKIIVSTDIAETSLTIEGVTVVIDSGLSRTPRFDPRTGMSRLKTIRISKDSSIQRAGRAGRTAAGTCYRLWSEPQQQRLDKHRTPEILQADLCSLVIQLMKWGVDDPLELNWLDPPPPGAFNQARELLVRFNAIHKDINQRWSLTASGEVLSEFPVHPRLAHLLATGASIKQVEIAAYLVAIIEEGTPKSFKKLDLQEVYRFSKNKNSKEAAWQKRIDKHAKQLIAKTRSVISNKVVRNDLQTLSEDAIFAQLIAQAYPDRIAQRKTQKQTYQSLYKLANGRSAFLPTEEPLSTKSWLCVVELGGQTNSSLDRIYSAVELPAEQLNYLPTSIITHHDICEWDQEKSRLVAETRKILGNIVISRKPLMSISPEMKQQALKNMIQERGLDILPWNESAIQWQSRMKLVCELKPDENWPQANNEALLASIDTWLLPYLNNAESIEDIHKISLLSILEDRLNWQQKKSLDDCLPQSIVAPTGRKHAIDYTQSPPVLRIKLQEMFGCKTTPSVGYGKVKLSLHLLSPAKRPLQVTQDLENFWASSYNEVKKEMKGRYPKHPWPDNPLEALPTHKTKKSV